MDGLEIKKSSDAGSELFHVSPSPKIYTKREDNTIYSRIAGIYMEMYKNSRYQAFRAKGNPEPRI